MSPLRGALLAVGLTVACTIEALRALVCGDHPDAVVCADGGDR